MPLSRRSSFLSALKTAVRLSRYFLCLAATAAPVLCLADDDIDEIRVTGSYVAAPVTPISVLSREDVTAFGATQVTEAIQRLTLNSGAEFNTDVFTQTLSAGTSNVNLRGLGLGSTLVLVNGRRQTVSGAVADDGSSFVDLNATLPSILVDRIEVLKDGASALYGTDAVAGVVNLLPRIGFDGFEVSADVAGTTDSWQTDTTLQAAWGGELGEARLLTGFSFLHRSALQNTDREFALAGGVSGTGQPGAFILQDQSAAFPDLPFGGGAASVIDPGCTTPSETTPGSGLGRCLFSFLPFYQVVPEEDRVNGTLFAELPVGEATLSADIGFALNRLDRTTSPSFPILTPPLVPADNPGNVFGVDALFLGRPLGTGDNPVEHDSDTYRLGMGVTGPLASWTYDVSLGYSRNSFYVGIQNAIADRFTAALNGVGGPNNDQFFNPFAGASNDPAVIDDFLGLNTSDFTTELFTAEAVLNGDFGSVALAAGAQLRREVSRGEFDQIFNDERFLFFIGGPDFDGARTVGAAFAEAVWAATDRFDVQVALRHEDYGSGLSSTDPKIAAAWQPTDWLGLSASFSTAFKAPTVFQTSSSQTVQQNIVDPVNGSQVFRAVRTVGSDDLAPEQADVWTTQIDIAPLEAFSLSATYWRFDYTDLIVKESAQAIVDANPFDPRVIRAAGEIVRVDSGFINASSVLTDGFDVALTGRLDTVTLSAEATHISRYRIQSAPDAAPQDVAGNRNFRNFARSLPKWRANVTGDWADGPFAASAALRYISGYDDDQSGARVASQVTLDIEASVTLPDHLNATRLSLGAINVTDEDPPFIATTLGFDTKVHDPRGRVIYLRAVSGF